MPKELAKQLRPELSRDRRARRHWISKAKSIDGHIDLESSGMGAPTIPVFIINEDDFPSLHGIDAENSKLPESLLRGLDLQKKAHERPMPRTGVIFDA